MDLIHQKQLRTQQGVVLNDWDQKRIVQEKCLIAFKRVQRIDGGPLHDWVSAKEHSRDK